MERGVVKKNQSQMGRKTQSGQETSGQTVSLDRLQRSDNAEGMVPSTVFGTWTYFINCHGRKGEKTSFLSDWKRAMNCAFMTKK